MRNSLKLRPGIGACLLLFCALSTQAADTITQRLKNVGFHVGSLTEFVGAVQVDDRGTKENFTLNPFLGFSTDVNLNNSWTWVPEINWVLPREAGDGITKNLFMVRADFAWEASDLYRLRIGTSLMVNNIRGQGGTKRMNNGSGTSEFYVPAESRTSVNNTLDLGGELFMEDFSLRFQTFIYALLRSDRRQYSYTLTLSYYYDL